MKTTTTNKKGGRPLPFAYYIDTKTQQIMKVPKGTILNDDAGDSTEIVPLDNGDTLYVKTTTRKIKRKLPAFQYGKVGLLKGDGIIEGDGKKPKTPLKEIRKNVTFFSET